MGDMVVVDQVEDLGFVDIPRIGEGVEDTIGVYRIVLTMACIKVFLRMPANGILAVSSEGRKEVPLPGIHRLFQPPQID